MNLKSTDDDLYFSRYGFLEIIKSMSEYIVKEQIKRVKESKFFSLIFDESTDMTSHKDLIIYIKYFDHSEFKIRTEFFKLIPLQNFSAESLKNVILSNFLYII